MLAADLAKGRFSAGRRSPNELTAQEKEFKMRRFSDIPSKIDNKRAKPRDGAAAPEKVRPAC